MSSILLGISGSDALVGDAELKPPDIEPSETMNAGGGEGGTVIAADGVGKAVLSKEAKELVFDTSSFHVG
jgi:hypothetical protein